MLHTDGLRRLMKRGQGLLMLSILFLTLRAIETFAQRPLGTDVSGHQPSVDWTAVKNAGVTFAWTKATEGTTFVSSSFTSQEAGAKAVGIYIGAYHFARPSINTNLTGPFSADNTRRVLFGVSPETTSKVTTVISCRCSIGKTRMQPTDSMASPASRRRTCRRG